MGTTEQFITIQLAEEQAETLIACIESAHAEFCIQSDNCDCYELVDILRGFLAEGKSHG